MKHLLGLIAITVGLYACEKKFVGWPDTLGGFEETKLRDGMGGKRYVFTKGVDTKGTDLLKTKYPCMADDTFQLYLSYRSYGGNFSLTVKIKQGASLCAPTPGDIETGWDIKSNYSDRSEVAIWFPFPKITSIEDSTGTVIGYNYYSKVGFFRNLPGKPHFRYDSLFNIEFIFYTDSTQEHYYMSSLPK